MKPYANTVGLSGVGALGYWGYNSLKRNRSSSSYSTPAKRQATNRRSLTYTGPAGSGKGSITISKKRRKSSRSTLTIPKRLKSYIKRSITNPKQKTIFHDFRSIEGFSISSAANQKGLTQYSCWVPVAIENNIVSKIYSIDDTATGVRVTQDLKELPNTKFLFKNCMEKFVVRNNNAGLKCTLIIYCLQYKDGTTTTPMTLSSNSWLDVTLGTNVDNDLRYPFIPQGTNLFSKFIKVLSKKTIELQPGQEQTATFKLPNFTYNPEEYDDHATAQIKGTYYFVFDLRGCVAHDDTTTTNVGISDASVDVVTWCYAKYGFEGGRADAKQCFNVGPNSLDALPNGASGVQEQNPGQQEKTEL